MSKKSNINMDYYKTKGRGRPGEAVAHEDYKHSFAQAIASGEPRNPSHRAEVGSPNRLSNSRRLQRMKRLRKRRGLSAKQLMERKLTQRNTIHPNGFVGTGFVPLPLGSKETVADT